MGPPITSQSALLLDIDGTILDFASTPDSVVVPPSLRDALKSIRTYLGGALAFVSGRSLASIDTIFGPLAASAVGAHGGEIRFIDGRVQRTEALPPFVRDVFFGLGDRFSELLIEDKTCAVALHYRRNLQALPELERSLLAYADAFAAANVKIVRGKNVLEARYLGVDKGAAIRTLMASQPFYGRRPIFGGDDVTDADVFPVLPALQGQGFSVGCAFEGAAYRFENPAAVRAWLLGIATDVSAPVEPTSH